MSDKVFKEYLSASEKEYKFTLKLAIDEVSDRMLDMLEACLGRYDIKTATAFKKTPIQESPLDFPNVQFSPVFISEIVTTYPASRDFLETYISKAIAVSEQKVVVYSENDPRAYETEHHLMVNDPAYKENYEPVMGEEVYKDDLSNEQAANLYGDGHNTAFLKELEEVRNTRTVDIVETPLSQLETTDPVAADYDTFNDQKDDAALGIFGRAPAKTELINKA